MNFITEITLAPTQYPHDGAPKVFKYTELS